MRSRRTLRLVCALIGLLALALVLRLTGRSAADEALAGELAGVQPSVLSGEGQLVPLESRPARSEEASDAGDAVLSRVEPAAQRSTPVAHRLVTYWCRTIDALDGSPVVGAKVEGLVGSGSDSSQVEMVSQSSGLDGLIELRVPASRASMWRLVRIDAPGHGCAYLSLEGEHGSRATAMDVRLSRSAKLIVSVIDADGRPVPEVRIQLLVAAYSITRYTTAPVFGSDLTWSGATTSAGLAEFDGLPAEAAIRISASHDRAGRWSPPDVVLTPGEEGRVEWRFGASGTIAGRLLDELSDPVADYPVWLTRGGVGSHDLAERRYLFGQPGSSDSVVQNTHTNDVGEFRFEGLPAGIWRVGPASGEKGPRAVAPVGTLVRLEDSQAIEGLELRCTRGLYMRGRVVLPDHGEPPSSRVSVSCPLGGLSATVAGGMFELGPLEPTPHEVVASLIGQSWDAGTGFASSAKVEVMPGGPPLELELRFGAKVSGTFVDALTGEPHAASYVITCEDPRHFAMSVGDDTTFESSGLQPGTYSICARSSDGLVGLERDIALTAGEHLAQLEIQLVEGARLRIRYRGETEYAHFEIRSAGAVVAFGSIQSGTSAVRQVPAGSLVVRSLRARGAEEQTVFCNPGQELELHFGAE